MPLTAIDIFKQLPNENCGECGVPTCLAFAMKLAQKQASLDECPRVTDEARAALDGAAAPPMATVKIGVGERVLEIGGETVLFRHEERFHHPCGIAIEVQSDLPEADLRARAEAIGKIEYDRVGMMLGVNLVAVRDAGGGTFAAAAKVAAEASGLPLVLMSDDPGAMREALGAVGAGKPLIYAATAAHVSDMAALAKEQSCPLAIRAESLDELASLSEQAAKAGVTQLVLDSGARAPGKVIQDQTAIRRAALRKKFRPFGFPTITFPQGDTPQAKALQACTYVAKYGGIVTMDATDPFAVLPIITERLNIYTDPQKPPQVKPGLYEVGEAKPDSPVLVTTNFSLTYYLVEGDVSASKVPAWIVVVDTDGTSVLTAWAGDKLTGETIAKAIKDSGVEEKVSHKKIVLPGGVAVLSGKVNEASGWEVLVGPRESSGIPSFFRQQSFA